MPLTCSAMREPALPDNESARLADLYDYGILDTPAEKVFDEIAQLAATICGTEFGAITLIDRDRQWFKAQHGLQFAQTSRGESICGHAILHEELFEVRDTRGDERFAGNPLLMQAPGIRFYGGSRLQSNRGHAIGMLCVMDPRPRELTDDQKRALEQLAKVVMAVIEAGRRTRLSHWFGSLLDNVQDEILIIDPDTLFYLHANRAAQEHLGHTLDEMRGLTPMDVTNDHDRPKFERFVQRLKAGAPFVTFPGVRCRSDGETYPVEARWQLLGAGSRSVVLSIVQDVTARNEAERVKDEFLSRLRHELEIARTMQRGLLPAPAQILGVSTAWFFQASSFVGGDTFEYMAIDDRRLAFFMLDVAGHGVPAAMMALSAQHQLYTLAREHGLALLGRGRSIADTALEVVNEYNRTSLQLKESDLYVTLLFGIYDSETHRMAVVQAGYPPPLVAPPGSRDFMPVGEGGIPIGILAQPSYEVHEIDAAPGTRIALHSDGVVECMNSRGAEFGSERLRRFLAGTRAYSGDRVADALGRELAQWRGGAGFEDDVTFVVLEVA